MTLSRQAIRGSLALYVRQGFIQAIGILGGIILTRILTPSEFGFYAICTFFFYFLLGVGDLGLGTSLVRQDEEPSVSDCRTVLTVRQVLDLIFFTCVWIAAPYLSEKYAQGPDGIFVFRMISAAALLSSFQIIPTVILERHLKFARLAIIETVQMAVYIGTIISLCVQGVGAKSFAWGWLAFALTGAVLSNLVCPWRIGWAFDTSRIRKNLPFALPFQGTTLLSLLKESITPVFIGVVLGTAAVGYINFAQMLALSVTLGLAVLQRVYLSAFSRALETKHTDKSELRMILEQLVFTANAIAAPIALFILIFFTPITTIVFGAKWLAAKPLFNVLWLVNLLFPTVTVFTAFLNAAGDSRWVFIYTMLSAAAMWVIGVPFISQAGATGYVWTALLVNLFSVVLIWRAGKYCAFNILRVATLPWMYSAAVGVGLEVLAHVYPPVRLLNLLLILSLGIFVYAVLIIFHGRSVALKLDPGTAPASVFRIL